MLNNVTSQTQHSNIKLPHENNFHKKVDEQIQELSTKIDELSNEIVTEKVTTDDIHVNEKLTAPNAEIDSINSKLVTSENIEAPAASIDNLTSIEHNTVGLNAKEVKAESIQTEQLTVTDTLQLNEVNATKMTATEGHFDTFTTDSITAPTASIDRVDSERISSENVDATAITVVDLTTDKIISNEINVPVVNAADISTTNVTADNATINDSEIHSLITDTFENKTFIKHTGRLNLDPEQLSVFDWYSIDIKLGNYTTYLWADYETINHEKHHFDIAIIGTAQTAVICYNEDALEVIKDFSFDTETGNLRIRFHGTEYLYYGLSTADDVVEPLKIIYNAEEFEFYHEPKRLRGYVFQSYNDNTVEFYFGGEVFVHSLSAEFQEFEEQMTKKLYVEKNILLPHSLNQDESVHDWDIGEEGDYITNRVNEFDHLAVKWEHKTNIIKNGLENHLIDAQAVIDYNGDVVTPNDDPALVEHEYPIVNLGDDTVTHGSHTVEDNFTTKHIYDGAPEDLPNLPDSSLVIQDATGTETVYADYTPDFTDTEIWTESVAPNLVSYICNVNYIYFDNGNWVQLVRVDHDTDDDVYYMKGSTTEIVEGLEMYEKKVVPRTSKITRKTTRGGEYKFDEVAVYESSATLVNNKPVIYNANNKSLKTSDELNIDELDVNKLTVRQLLDSRGDTITKHIYDGVALGSADLALRPNGSLYIDDTTNTLYRKSTNDDTTVRLDRLATLKDGVWTSKDGFTLVYDEATDTLKPTKDLSLNELDLAGDLRVGGDAYITGTLHYTKEELIESTSDFILLRSNNSASLAVGEESGIAINNYDGTHTLAIATDRTGTARVGTGTGTSTTYNDIYYGLTDSKWYSDAELTIEVTPQGNLSSWATIEKTDDYYHYTDAVFKVIDFTDMQAIATRDEEAAMSHNAITKWNAEDKKLQTLPLPVRSEQTLEAVVTVDDTDPEEPITTVGYTWVDKKAGVLHFTTEAAYTAYEATHNVPNDTLVIIDEYDTNLMGDNQI